MYINVNRLTHRIEAITNSYKYYETILFDTLSCIKNMKYFWKDGYTNSFFKNIDKQLNNVNNLTDEIIGILDIIKSVANNYARLGISINDYTGIISSDNYTYNGLDIDENQVYKNNIYREINNIEDNISAYISKRSFFTINIISYYGLDKEEDNSDFIGMQDNMPNEIKRLELKISNLKSACISLINSFQIDLNIYNSPNCYKIKKLIEQLNNDLSNTNNSIDNAYNYIKRREIDTYKLTDTLLNNVNKISR